MVNIFLIKGSYKITESNKKINYGPRTEIKKKNLKKILTKK